MVTVGKTGGGQHKRWKEQQAGGVMVGETARETGSPLAGPVVGICLECDKRAGQGGG